MIMEFKTPQQRIADAKEQIRLAEQELESLEREYTNLANQWIDETRPTMKSRDDYVKRVVEFLIWKEGREDNG